MFRWIMIKYAENGALNTYLHGDIELYLVCSVYLHMTLLYSISTEYYNNVPSLSYIALIEYDESFIVRSQL